ncbi:MAG TPA: FAD-dependent thymidylate synthase [Bacillota bacterium]|nr:FAD-dependent thymidylate synthase [Bacillota bacterium]
MKIIEAGYIIEDEIQGDLILKRLERAGRTCYKSEERIGPYTAGAFLKRIIDSAHDSVLEHEKLTIRFICDRGVSHELVRHRIASFSQESTRYCNYGKDKYGGEITVIKPSFWKEGSPEWESWQKGCEAAEAAYLQLLELGASPEQARGVLPTAVKTEIVVTANLREWRHILSLRTNNRAHPQIREIMIPLLKELQGIIPVIFDDIRVDEGINE